MRNSDESPGSRHREHYYQSKNKRKDSDEDENDDDKYRQEDLRTKLNELKKSKDHHRERPSSSDKDHNKHRNSRQLQVHDYDTGYHKSNQNKRDRESGNRDPYYSSYPQKSSSHYYQQEHRSYTSDNRHSDKRSSKSSISTLEKYVEVENKSDPNKRSKMRIEAEVNEIVSEEEEQTSDDESSDEETKLKSSSKKSQSPNDNKKDLRDVDEDSNSKNEQENNENIQAEIELRNKLKRRIQQEAELNQDKEENKRVKSDSDKKVKRSQTDSASRSGESTPRSPCSTRSNASDTDPDTQDVSSSTKNNKSGSSDTSDNKSRTPERQSESNSESEKDELDEKIEIYYKQISTKKRVTKSEETNSVVDKDEEEKPRESMTPPPLPPPIQLPEIIMHYCASQGCRSVEEFECLNKIEEGAYGVVYRAKDKRSGELVALKRLKMEKEKEGFPITSIREIDTLLKAQHPNVVTVREIVVGFDIDRIFMVMDYVEHDLKSLMQYSMKKPFMMAEVKTLMIQLLRGVAHLHDNWIIHRDLKTSNLLLSHKGVLKIADFGLAREYGSPLKEYTAVVVTLWYRCPELLLGTKKYSTPVDIWSVGCIFGELMLMKALFNGKNENDQLNKIFKDLGTPNEKIWPGFKDLPIVSKLNFQSYPYNTLRSRFGNYLSDKGFELITKLLTYDPNRRISAEEALKHDFFKETPLPIDPSMFPTWPAKSEGLAKNKIPKDSEPRAPSPAKTYEKLLKEDEGFVLQFPTHATGFTLR